MLLAELKRYAETRLDLTPPFYEKRPVRYVIHLDSEGRVLTRRPVDTATGTKGREARGALRVVPTVQRAAGTKPLLLADNAEYLFGWVEDGGSLVRAAQRHDAMRALMVDCKAYTGVPQVAAVLAFLSGTHGTTRDLLELPADFAEGEAITFTVDGVFVADLPEVRAFWEQHNDPAAHAGASALECLVCGVRQAVLNRLPGKIKGVPKGQTSGTAIISANSNAFESYGLTESRIAPVCANCAQKFTEGLNSLLGDPASRYFVHDTVSYAFWTREAVEFDVMSWLNEPDPVSVRQLFRAMEKGASPAELDATRFFGVALAGSGGRAAVRDWIDTTVGDAQARLAAWFKDMEIIGPHGEEPRPFGIYALAASTVRDPKRELTPHVMRALFRTALAGSLLPADLMVRAIQRIRAGDDVTHSRASLIKAVLIRSVATADGKSEENPMAKLNETHPSPAYQCGRLLAVLENAQRAAMGKLSTTIVDRFYGAASTAPVSVFGRLLGGAQAHLSKLERDRPGAWRRLEQQLEDVISGLDGFPATLTLSDQGLFAMGFYHQRAHDRSARNEAAIARKANGGALSSIADHDDPQLSLLLDGSVSDDSDEA